MSLPVPQNAKTCSNVSTEGIAETREVITGDHFGLIIGAETQSGRIF